MLGLIQSVCFPSFVSVIANWFSKENRGLAVGGFCTCTCIGNIVGAQVGQALITALNDQWQWLFVILAANAALFVVLLRVFLIPHPEEAGFLVDDEKVEPIIDEKLTHLYQKRDNLIVTDMNDKESH